MRLWICLGRQTRMLGAAGRAVRWMGAGVRVAGKILLVVGVLVVDWAVVEWEEWVEWAGAWVY